MVAFIVVEWKFAVMPMMPLRLFKIPAVCAILIQNFLYGIVYYSQLYYLPIYYQNAHRFSALMSAVLIIPVVLTQSLTSVLSGQYISRTKRYGEVIWVGFIMWTLGSGLILLFDRSTPKWQIIVCLIVQGIGIGNVFQPTLIASQAHTFKRDRAVVISVRNFLRCLGGALGLAMASGVFSNVLKNKLNTLSTPIPATTKSAILASILHVPDLSLMTNDQKEEILDAYMSASKGVFLTWVPVIGVCLLFCFLIKDKGLTRPEEKSDVQSRDETVTSVEHDVEKHGSQDAPSRDETEAAVEHDVEKQGSEEVNK